MSAPEPYFHVTSVRNRESIAEHGLDWTRMGAASGIAGGRSQPEADGVFLCHDDSEAQFFVRLNNTGGPVDVWAVDGVDEDSLIESGNGFYYLPDRVPTSHVRLVRSAATSARY